MTTIVPLYRSRILTSIHGGRLGLDKDQMIVGPPDIKRDVRTISSTVPNTSVTPHGVVTVSGLSSTQGPVQHSLDAPVPGVPLTLQLACTSTGSQQFNASAAGASIVNTSAGTTSATVNLLGPGGSITLIGLSTSQWGVRSMNDASSTAGGRSISFTTST